MNVQDVLQWVDNLMFEETGEHLTPIQEAILTGVWQRQKYPQIAKDFKCSESHIKKEAAKLWEKLGEQLGEDLNKFNFRSKVEKQLRVYQGSNLGYCVQINQVNEESVNIWGEGLDHLKNLKSRSLSPPDTPQNKNQTPIIDLKQAPALTEYYPRTTEETTLKNWILNTTTRLITIYGLTGIGKSSLTLQLIQEIQNEFDYIIWQTLNDKPTLTTLQTNLKQIFFQTQKTPLPTILDYFRTYRCLIIIDDLQNIFKTREIAGQYLPEYEDYSQFFKQIATTTHQSCLILLTSEKPREITTLEGENRPAKKLHLKGLGEQAKQILKQYQLIDEEKWPQLITLYQSHPTWLNIIASTIQEFFNGSVSQYLADPNDIYLGDIEPVLETQLKRLSDSEKTVIRWLASQTKPVELSQTPAETALSKTQFLQTIESLNRRSLVEKEQLSSAKAMFQINPIFKQYIQLNPDNLK